MLDRSEKHGLAPVALDTAEAYVGVDFRPPPHLTLVKGEDTNVVPLQRGRQAGAVPPWPLLHDSRSIEAIRGWFVQSLLVEAIVRDRAGDDAAAGHALERALALAEHGRVLSPFLVDPIPELLQHHADSTAHAGVICEIFDLLARVDGAVPLDTPESLREPLTEAEIRVLRLLATDLSKREIGNELCVSVNTIKTHVKHLYAKLEVRTRRQAIGRARALRLLPSSLCNR